MFIELELLFSETGRFKAAKKKSQRSQDGCEMKSYSTILCCHVLKEGGSVLLKVYF